MTNDKVNEVLESHIKRLEDAGYQSRRYDVSAVGPVFSSEARRHILWMANEALKIPAEKLEKKMRWLGFIQGVAWVVDGFSIDMLKKQNMPDEEKTGG